ncbi:MAG: gliding motility-associated C-terminal domain-containing protein [Bacteroidetes bacterium]|nr:gliding motility-associated C-terminal domain-containing protein [Bacteroidota bacterium]
MKKLKLVLISISILFYFNLSFAQITCNPAGNVVIFSNYDGSGSTPGTRLNIDIDVNIPNLKIGICSYERLTVNIGGAFAGNVTEVIYAGYNATGNNHCGSVATSLITGVSASIISYTIMPPATYTDPDGWNNIICSYQCTAGNQGGCNTAGQVVGYFMSAFGAGNIFRMHETQYGCWNGVTKLISTGGNCCLVPPSTNPPNANFTVSDSSVCVGSCLNFTDLSTNTPTSWNWVFTGGTPGTSNIQNPSNICYNSPGSYPVTLTASNSYGTDVLTKTSYIVVTANPTVSINPPSISICPGDSTSLTATGASTYSWSPSTGLNSTTGTTVMAGPVATTIYTVTGSTSGCTGTSTSVVTVSALPNLTVNPNATTICNGASDTLIASGATSYSWSPSTGLNTTVGNTVIANPTSTTVYSVTGTISGCTNSTSVAVTVNQNPVITVNNPIICNGGTTTLTANGGTTYLWNTGATSNSIIVSPSSSTTYTITGTLLGCSGTNTASVTVNPLPIASITGDTLICPGTSIVLNANGGTNYLWNSSATTQSITVSPNITSTYTVTVSSSNCSATSSITINTFPNAIANAGNDVTINIGESTQLTGSGGVIYSWSPTSDLSCSDCPNPTANPLATTIYQLIVTDNNGCIATDTMTVFVEQKCGEVYIPNAFSPNNDTQNDFVCAFGNCIQVLNFTIYDRWGEKVFETNDPKTCWDGRFKGEILNSGVFVYYMTATLFTGEIIKKQGNINLFR